MTKQLLNRVAGRVLVALSLAALVSVVSGYFQVPQRDEGTAAHLFQLSVVAFVLVAPVFLVTRGWEGQGRSARPLIISATGLALAFAGLYYLEHYFYLH